MSFEIIPISELAKYLNQIDMYNLSLTSKYFYNHFTLLLSEIKKYISTRSNCLSIYFVGGKDETEYVVYYTFQTISGNDIIDVSPSRKFKVKNESMVYIGGDRALFISTTTDVIKELPTKNGDVVWITNHVSILKKSKSSIYLLMNENIVKIRKDLADCILPATIPLGTYSIFHWIWSVKYILYLIPNMNVRYDNEGNAIYVEISTTDFLFRVNCKKSKPTNKQYKSLLINHKSKEIELRH